MLEDKVDLHLIKEVKQGNKEAFDVLVLKYQYKIFKAVARFTRDPSEVLDIAQDTFMKAYRSIYQFRGDSTFYTWLYRIAINAAKNHVFSQGRQVKEINFQIDDMEEFMSRHISQGTEAPENVLICEEISAVLGDTIDHLSAELQESIMLREIEGLSYEEIADKMHCPIGTVRSRIFRARGVITKNIQPFMEP